MTNFFNRFVRDESGVTAMEYGMIAALIAVVILGVLGTLGDDLKTTFDTIEKKIAAANAKAG
jgi:pilus assembly protein Flp/PilA